MSSSRRFRAVGSLALALFVFAGLPGTTMAAGAKPQDDASLNISGTVTAIAGGAPISGIEVYFVGTVTGHDSTTVVTGSNGAYSLPVYPSDTYSVHFNDPAGRYLFGMYDTSAPGNLNIGSNDHTGVPVDAANVGDVDVHLTAGKRISGTVTGPATPANRLAGITVVAESTLYYAYTSTASDGTYSIAVPTGNFTVQFQNGQGFYDRVCYWDGGASHDLSGDCVGAVVVDGSDVSGVSVNIGFREGVELVVAPAGDSVASKSSKAFTATLTNPGPKAIPAGKGGPSIANVSDYTTFTIDPSGSCSGKSCTPPAVGDYTITGTYGGLTAHVTLHSTAADPGATPPPTSTEGQAKSRGGSPIVLLLLGLVASAFMVAGIRRRVSVHN